MGRKKGEREARETIEEIKGSVIRAVPVSEELIFKAALFKLRYPLAYADGFALATAVTVGGALITGDPELRKVEEAPVLWIDK